MPTTHILSLAICFKSFHDHHKSLWFKLLLVLSVGILGSSIQAQNVSKDTVTHKYKVTQVYCKITTTHGHLQNETFHIYYKDKVVHELTITDHITEYYFPISIESWSPLEELYAYLDDDHKHYYHFKKRKRKDDVYEYDLVIDLTKIKRRENRHKKHGH